MINETPTLAETIKTVITSELVGLNTCLPGVVEKYDAPTKTADIKPTLKRRYTKDNELVSLPVIPNVPMCFMQTKTSLISMPIKVGDDVLIIFSERSIDNWKSSQGGKEVDTADTRKFALSDAFAIPIAKPLNTGVSAEAEPIYIKNISSEGRFHEGGQIKLENPIAFMDIADNGDIELDNDACNDKLENSGTMTRRNTVSTLLMEAAGKNEIKNANANIKEDADGTLTISNTNCSIILSSAGTITITTPSGSGEFKSDGSFQFNGTGGEKISMSTGGAVEIGGAAATTVNFGAGTEPILTGTTAKNTYNAHKHTAPGGGGITSVPDNTLDSALSGKVNTE